MRKTKIIDCFIFFEELDMLEGRFKELYDKVDHFILVESNKTFTNQDKPLFFDENKERFSKWLDKVYHIIVDDMPDNLTDEELSKLSKDLSKRNNDWAREFHQRNAISRGFKELNLSFEDIIIVSDVDEIPNLNKLDEIKSKLPYNPLVLEQKWFVWNVDYEKQSSNWRGSCVFQLQHWLDRKNCINDIREIRWDFSPYFDVIKDGGTHFSWFGNHEFIRNKIFAFSHSELAGDFWLDDKNIDELIIDGYASNGINRDAGHLKKSDFTDYTPPDEFEYFSSLGFKIKSRDRKIYDCFLFDNELDMLNLRLSELYDYVDHFVIVEATNSHSGEVKELYYDKHKDLFKKFSDKIIHHVCTLPDEILYEPSDVEAPEDQKLNRFRENYNRNEIKTILDSQNLINDDIILISDLDEIPDTKIFEDIDKYLNDSFTIFLQRWHHWNFDWDFGDNYFWPGIALCKWSFLKNKTPQFIRSKRYDGTNTYYDEIIGWHLSWFGNIDMIKYKFKNSAHQELYKMEDDEINNFIYEGIGVGNVKLEKSNSDRFPLNKALLDNGTLFKLVI